MSAGFPNARIHDDGAFDTDHVIPRRNHAPPPGIADIAPQYSSQRSEIIKGGNATVDFARRVHKASLLAERDQLVDGGFLRRGHFSHCPASLLDRGWLPPP